MTASPTSAPILHELSGPHGPRQVVTAPSARLHVYIFQAIGNPGAGGGGRHFMRPLADGLGSGARPLAPAESQEHQLQTYDGGNPSEMSPRPVLFLHAKRR